LDVVQIGIFIRPAHLGPEPELEVADQVLLRDLDVRLVPHILGFRELPLHKQGQSR